MARLKITQTKSGIGYKQNQRETLRSLGLKRMHDTVVKEDRPEIRGMVADRHAPGDGRGGRLSHDDLKVHHLRPAPGSHTKKTRVGRGEGSKGKTAGRGTKGTKARYQVPAGFEGGQMPIHMRLPKLKGFKNRFRVEYQVVNVAALAELFPEGGTVGVDELVAAGAVRKGEPVKVLGNGDLGGVKLDITAQRVLRLGPGQDRRRRRLGHPALSVTRTGLRCDRVRPLELGAQRMHPR